MKKLSLLFFFALLGVLFTSGAYAQPANSITFNGTNQYMRIPNHADFQISPTESFSVSLWINNAEYGNFKRYVCKRVVGGEPSFPSGYELWVGNPEYRFDWALNVPYGPRNNGTYGGNVISAFCNERNRLNTWIHVGFTIDRTAGKVYMYENGVKIKESPNALQYSPDDTSPWRADNTLDVLVGAAHGQFISGGPATTLDYFLKGSIGNLRFWDKALSADEMLADMTAEVTAATPNLLAGYDFKDYIGKRYIPDVKGNHPGELFNYPVANPVFSLPAGEYAGEQTITITSETEGATIYYTLDGTNPTESSMVYSAPITITETTTVKAIAIKTGQTASAIVSATYTILDGWNIPTGTVHATEARYITSATTTGANTNLSYTQSTKPTQVYINTNAAITSNVGDSFTLNVKTTDMTKWCHAIIFIDWNRNFSFDDDGELIAKIGLDSWESASLPTTGNPTVNDFTQSITIPSNAFIGKTRMRIQLTDAWHDKTPNHTHSGEDVIDKGGVYDFDLNINNLGTGFDKLPMDGMGFYPNPANDFVTVENALKVSVYTLDGKMIISQNNAKEGAWTLNVSSLKQGVYILKLTNEAGTVNKKLIKQ